MRFGGDFAWGEIAVVLCCGWRGEERYRVMVWYCSFVCLFVHDHAFFLLLDSTSRTARNTSFSHSFAILHTCFLSSVLLSSSIVQSFHTRNFQ